MKQIILILIAVFVLPAVAPAFDGEIWVGQYSSQNYPADPDFDFMAEYTAGVELGHRMEYRGFALRPFFRVDTLNDSRDGLKLHPAGIRYFWGARLQYEALFVEFEHHCWHPVDSGGDVWEYDLVKIGASFGKGD